MELQALETLGKVAGIGGIAVGVMLLVFRDALRKSILSKMTRQQSFRIVTMSMVLVWSVALAGIAAWAWTETRPDGTGPSGGSSVTTSGDNSPVIQDVNGSVKINSGGN